MIEFQALQNAEEAEHKTAFAAELLKTPADPFRAALAVFPTNTNRALWVANYWPSDAFVTAEMGRLTGEHGELAFLPTKAEAARKAWDMAASEKFIDYDDRIKALRLFSEICDYIPKIPRVALTNPDGKGNAAVTVVASPLDEQL